jgi:hypothetical protein
VQVGFDGGPLTSDVGIFLLAAIEQRLKIAESPAACIEDRRDPERVLHGRAHYPTRLIAANIGYRDRAGRQFRPIRFRSGDGHDCD